MNKILTFVIASTCASILHANHCPPANEIFRKEGSKYITLTPPGWRWTESWGGKPRFKSSEVQLNWAMWSSSRLNREDERRVHCIYGNPYFDGSESCGLLQTVDIIPRSQIENKPNWNAFGEDYFRCYGSDVMKCQFG